MRKRDIGRTLRGDIALAVAAVSVVSGGCAVAEVVSGEFHDVGSDVTPRFFHRASVLDSGEILVSGGMRVQLVPPTLISQAALSFYDPRTESFSSVYEPTDGGPIVMPMLAVARSSHTQTALADGRVLFTGGLTGARGTNPGTAISTVELFDPITGLVETGPSMSAARAGHTATRLPDGRVVVAGGGVWEIFVPGTRGGTRVGRADKWSRAMPLQRSRVNHAAVLLPDGGGPGVPHVLIIGGGGSGRDTLERLDPAAGTSTLSSQTLAVGVDDLAAGRLDDDTVLIVGGQDLTTGDTVDCTYRYDPARDEITSVPPPPDRVNGIADHQLVVRGRFAFVFGGEQQVAGVDTELDYAAVFDRAAESWVPLGSMDNVHDDFASAVLIDGRILLIDGGIPFLGQEVASNFVEVFTPSTLRPLDIDGNGSVDFGDLLAVLSAWGPCPPSGDCPEDVNFSGAVDFGDLLAIISGWGPCA